MRTNLLNFRWLLLALPFLAGNCDYKEMPQPVSLSASFLPIHIPWPKTEKVLTRLQLIQKRVADCLEKHEGWNVLVDHKRQSIRISILTPGIDSDKTGKSVEVLLRMIVAQQSSQMEGEDILEIWPQELIESYRIIDGDKVLIMEDPYIVQATEDRVRKDIEQCLIPERLPLQRAPKKDTRLLTDDRRT